MQRSYVASEKPSFSDPVGTLVGLDEYCVSGALDHDVPSNLGPEGMGMAPGVPVLRNRKGKQNKISPVYVRSDSAFCSAPHDLHNFLTPF